MALGGNPEKEKKKSDEEERAQDLRNRKGMGNCGNQL